MKFINSVIYAFSMYSRIPMPNINYEKDDKRYVLFAFPFVGAVIGLLFYGWYVFCNAFDIGNVAFLLIGTAIPVFITGGFHIDGFMDTMDAVCSLRSREEKLRILKDSHIGAFSVIRLLLYYFIYIAALSEIKNIRSVLIISMGFVISRALSALGAVCFKQAKGNGSLKAVSDNSVKRTVCIALAVMLLICFAGILIISAISGILVILGALGSFVYYRYFSIKHFGGITGDTAGYFLLICEEVIAIAVVIGERFS